MLRLRTHHTGRTLDKPVTLSQSVTLSPRNAPPHWTNTTLRPWRPDRVSPELKDRN
jgi:hypothetical protein